MAGAIDGAAQPSRARMVAATVAVCVTVFVVWKVIDYRSQPPPPPHPITAEPPSTGG